MTLLISRGRRINFKKGTLVGDETASPDAEQETAAENLHNTYAAMPEDRQRRFWVRFFIDHPKTGEIICLKFF